MYQEVRGSKRAERSAAIKLRVEQRASIDEISLACKVPKSTLHYWLKPFPLTNAERTQRQQTRLRGNQYGLKPRRAQSRFAAQIERLSKSQRAKVAEAAVLFRMCIHGIDTYGRVFDGDKFDWIADVPGKPLLKIQVKCTSNGKHGLPVIVMRCSSGRNRFRRYTDNEFDFLVGYDLNTDAAYVFSRDEVASHATAVTVTEAAHEAFVKICR